jgi:hypothetical protein
MGNKNIKNPKSRESVSRGCGCETDSSTTDYFNLVKHKLRKMYEENENNPFNLTLTLDKKDFASVSSSRRVSSNNKKEYIYWKDYLTDYLLRKTKKGHIWCSDLLEYNLYNYSLINAETFLSENKWLSLFFWQEYELRTKPQCLVPQSSKQKDENEIIAMVSDKLSGSFVSINSANLSINDPTFEYREYRHRVSIYMKIFKEHVFDKDHPFNIIARNFAKVFSSYIQTQIREIYMLKNSSNKDANKEIEYICEDILDRLRKFIIKLQTALRLMYVKTLNYNCFIEEKDEFINLVTSLVINEPKVHDKLYELFEVVLHDQIKLLEARFGDFKNIKPQDLGIHEKFCLNDKTLAFQKRLLEENKTTFRIPIYEEQAKK